MCCEVPWCRGTTGLTSVSNAQRALPSMPTPHSKYNDHDEDDEDHDLDVDDQDEDDDDQDEDGEYD